MGKTKTRQQRIADKLILFSSLWMLFIKCFSFSAIVVNGSIAIVGIFCFLYYLFRGNKQQKKRVALLNLFLSICMIISILYNGNANMEHVLWIWAYSGVAMLIVEYGISKLTGFIVFWVTVVVIFVFALIGGRPEDFYQFGSANNISTIFVFAYFIYFVSCTCAEEVSNLSVLPPFIFVFISIWSSNRSGLVVAAFMFLGVFLLNSTMSKRGKRIWGVISIIVVFVLVYYYWNSIYSMIGEDFSAKSERYGMESVRTSIWSEYINVAFSNFYDFVFGVSHKDPFKTPLLSYWEGNTHNCFLMLHSKYGIMGFVVLIFLIFKMLFRSFRKKQFYDLFIMITVIIRGFFDWIAFPGLLDIAFFWFIFKQYRYPELNKQYY